MSFAGQVSITIAVRVAIIAAGLLSSVITARFLGPEGRGAFFFWTTLAAIAIQFGNLGLHSSNTHLFAKQRVSLSVLLANSACVSLLVACFVVGCVAVVALLSPDIVSGRWVYLVPTIILIPTGLYFTLGVNLLVANDRINDYNAFELTNRTLTVAALCIAVYFLRSVQSALVAIGVVSLLLCLALHLHLLRQAGKAKPSYKVFRQGFGYALRAYVAAVFAFFVMRLNVFLLEGRVAGEVFGVWSVATQLFEVLMVIPGAFALVLLPRVMKSTRPFEMMRSQARSMLLVMVAIAGAVILAGKLAIVSLYGPEYSNAYGLLLYSLPGAIAVGVVTVISQYLAAEGMPLQLVWIWFGALVFQCAGAVLAIEAFGAKGAMMALSATYILLWVLIWRLAVAVSKKHGDIIVDR
jgi:O-antigen/teichoic acid export membrane protein